MSAPTRSTASWARPTAAAADIAQRLPLGTRLRILPNHACATGAQHDHYHLVQGTQVQQTWPRFSGW
jgi:D-serine deaminase-like pyridoxal phosphate-dependent protein